VFGERGHGERLPVRGQTWNFKVQAKVGSTLKSTPNKGKHGRTIQKKAIQIPLLQKKRRKGPTKVNFKPNAPVV